MPTNDPQVFAISTSKRLSIIAIPLVIPQGWVNTWQLAEFTPNVSYFGDIWAGGTIQPTMFRVDNTARHYVTDPQLDIKGTGYRFYVAAGAYLAVNNAIPSRFTDFAGGTIDTF